MSNVKGFTPWGSSESLALPQQLLQRVKDAKDAGREHYVFAVFVEKNDRGNYEYSTTYSECRPEVALMAIHELYERTMETPK